MPLGQSAPCAVHLQSLIRVLDIGQFASAPFPNSATRSPRATDTRLTAERNGGRRDHSAIFEQAESEMVLLDPSNNQQGAARKHRPAPSPALPVLGGAGISSRIAGTSSRSPDLASVRQTAEWNGGRRRKHAIGPLGLWRTLLGADHLPYIGTERTESPPSPAIPVLGGDGRRGVILRQDEEHHHPHHPLRLPEMGRQDQFRPVPGRSFLRVPFPLPF